MSIVMPALGVAFASFSVWIMLRFIKRHENRPLTQEPRPVTVAALVVLATGLAALIIASITAVFVAIFP
jgi:hypothetical protein